MDFDIERWADYFNTSSDELISILTKCSYEKLLNEDITILEPFDEEVRNNPDALGHFTQLYLYYKLMKSDGGNESQPTATQLPQNLDFYKQHIRKFRDVLAINVKSVKGGMKKFVEVTTNNIVDKYELSGKVSRELLILGRSFIRIMGQYILDLSPTDIKNITLDKLSKDVGEMMEGVKEYTLKKNISNDVILEGIYNIANELKDKDWVVNNQFYSTFKTYFIQENGDLYPFEKLKKMVVDKTNGGGGELNLDMQQLISMATDKSQFYKFISTQMMKNMVDGGDGGGGDNKINYSGMSRADRRRLRLQDKLHKLEIEKSENARRQIEYEEEIEKREIERRKKLAAKRRRQRQAKKREESV